WIPFGAHRCLHSRYARRMTAIIDPILSFLQPRIHERNIPNQPESLCRLAVNTGLDTPVAPFTCRTGNVRLAVQIERRIFKLKGSRVRAGLNTSLRLLAANGAGSPQVRPSM